MLASQPPAQPMRGFTPSCIVAIRQSQQSSTPNTAQPNPQLKLWERIAGGSVYWLNDTVDGGPLAAQDWCFVRPGDTPSSLWRRELLPMGLRLFEKTLKDISREIIVRIPQEEKLATWEPSFGAAPLSRPDLPELTDGRPLDFRVIAHRNNNEYSMC